MIIIKKKVITTIICIILIIFVYNGVSYAAKVEDGDSTGEETGIHLKTDSRADTIDKILDAANDFVNPQDKEQLIDETTFQKGIKNIYNIFFAIGLVATVVVGMILGIKFITASVEGKAEVKQQLAVYAVGCAIIFGAFGIWRIVIIILSDIVS